MKGEKTFAFLLAFLAASSTHYAANGEWGALAIAFCVGLASALIREANDAP